MNLNALINPSSRGGYTWSRLLPQQPQATGQYDGFNYLGLGVLILVAVALLYSLWHSVRCPATAKSWWKRNAPLFEVCGRGRGIDCAQFVFGFYGPKVLFLLFNLCFV